MTELTAHDLAARYAAAERLLPHRWPAMVDSGVVHPRWEDGALNYSYQTTGDVRQVRIDLTTGARSEAPAPPIAAGPESVSPDGIWSVLHSGHDLILMDKRRGTELALTSDGQPDLAYGRPTDASANAALLDLAGVQLPPHGLWSPDSRRFVTHKLDQRPLGLMPYVQASPPDGGRPRLRQQRYAVPGDPELTVATLHVFDVDGTRMDLATPPLQVAYASPFDLKEIWWESPDVIGVLSYSRGDRCVQLWRVNVATGRCAVLVEEDSDTQIQLSPLYGEPPNVRILTTGEVLWWSERSGWGHLYLCDDRGGCRALTTGQWLVRDLVSVDEATRTAYFTAAGREVDLDPYVRQLYTVDLDSGDVRRLTHDEWDHQVSASPDSRWFVDVTSALDVPGSSLLLDADGGCVAVLETGDATQLREAGWRAPERFTVFAADGVTQLYGLLFIPPGLDPAQRYPILDDIYPGPQMGATTVRFPLSGAYQGTAMHAPAMAALGFVVVVLDARGTPLRSKAFQEHCRGARRDDNLADHVSAIRQLAQTRPWMDTSRIGIYGKSGGGFASTRALLRHPYVFSVAVSACGPHDERMYHAVWGEKYVGTQALAEHPELSNVALADQLQGKLLLIHGELDDNVPPHLTMRLVDAFMAADKDVDLLIVPNADHALLPHQAHWTRRRWDYFISHLMGVQPPDYRIAPIPYRVG